MMDKIIAIKLVQRRRIKSLQWHQGVWLEESLGELGWER